MTRKLCISLFLMILLLISTSAEAAPYEQIGPVGAAPYGISADGSTIVGEFAGQGFRWTVTGGFQVLGGEQAIGVSADGSLVAMTATDGGLMKAAYWTEELGIQLLEDIPGASSCDAFFSSSYAISDDDLIVGLAWVANCRAHAFRSAPGMESIDLGTTVEGRSSRANGISGNGDVIAGWQDATDGYRQGAIWVDDVQTLLWDTDGNTDIRVGEASSANYDGSTVIGSVSGSGEAWKWDGGPYVESIGKVPGFVNRTYANDVSNDGSVIVGAGTAGFSQVPFIWTEETGMVKLEEYLISVGITEAEGIDLGIVNGISGDGKVITGWGYQSDLSVIGWRINLAEAPASVDPSPHATQELVLLPAQPNPFSGSTQIQYTNLKSGGVSLGVHDVSGRLVRSLPISNVAGSSTTSWDGRDQNGRDVSAGTYFVRLQGESDSDTQRVVLIR